MIKYDYTVTVTGNTAKLDKDIYLFRGNKNVHYYFAIKNASFNFKGTTDLIEKTNAINAAVTVVKPNAVEVANAIAEVENGKIHLKVTEDLIDEEVEVGDFDLVFDLFDDTDGAVTIPKVIGQFHVLERPCTTPISELVATNTTNEVDQALTDYAITTYAEPVASTNEDGTFAKKTWVPKEKITTAELNRMEEGISDVSSQCKDIANYSLEKKSDDGKLYLKKGTEYIGSGIEFPTDNVPDNVVTYKEETGDSVVTAENIKLTDTGNNFTATNVEGALSELFQSASNGKQLIATAITGKGVTTNASDSFQTMATNIGNIQNGGTGITPTGTKEITENGTYDVTNFASALVNVPKNTSSGTITGTFTGADELTKTIDVGSNFTNFLLMTDAFSSTISYGSRLVIFIGVIDSVLRYQIMSNNTGAGVLGYIKSSNGNMETSISGNSITISNFSGTTPTYFKSGVVYRWYAW